MLCVHLDNFCLLRRDKHFQTSPKYSGLNLSCARQAFKKLVKKDNIRAEVCNKQSETSFLQKTVLLYKLHGLVNPLNLSLNISDPYSLNSKVEKAVLHFLLFLDKKPVGVEGLRIYLLLNELLYAIQKRTRQQNTKLAEAVAAAVTGLSRESLQVIGTLTTTQ